MKTALACILGVLVCLAWAQEVTARRVGGTLYLSLNDIAATLGYTVSASDTSLTVRAAAGVLVVFEASPDILFRAASSDATLENSDQSLSVPVLEIDDVWFAPEELLPLLGLELSSAGLELPGGRTLTLTFPPEPSVTASERVEQVDIGGVVSGLRFYAPGVAGPETLSLLITDAGLLALAFPERQHELDTAMAKFKEVKPLYFVVTALTETAWPTRLELSQDGRMQELAYPFGLNVLQGSLDRIAPDAPVAGLLLLPAWVNLRQPLTLSWDGVAATTQFRR